MQKDIIDIYKLFNLNLFSTEVILISAFLAFFLLFLTIFYSKYKIYYQELKSDNYNYFLLKQQYYDLINNLRVDKEDFFFEINLLLRKFLEDYNIIPDITKMTKDEIISNNPWIEELKNFIEECEKYEFGKNNIVSREIKLNLKKEALSIIKKI